MLVVLIVELHCHDLSKNVPFSQAKSLIKHGKLFLCYFNASVMKFHQNCRVLTNVLGGPTSMMFLDSIGHLASLLMYFGSDMECT